MIVMNTLKNEKGQSLVEFAIILPILLLLLFGIAEFGIMLNSYLTIQNVAREGARLGIIGGSDVEIISLIRTTSPNLTSSDMSITITPSEISRRSGDTLTVTVAYKYHMTVPIISSLVGNVIVLTAQTSMRIE
jgi:Flp pilus assembly protein TadG